MISIKGYETPPSSDVEPEHALPPSPPASPKPIPARTDVDRLLGAIRLLKNGRVSGRYIRRTYNLSSEEFDQFKARLGDDETLEGYYKDKVRCDYDPRDGEYVLRMPPSALHERLIALVEDRIEEELKKLARDFAADGEGGSAAAGLIEKVRKGRSSTFSLEAPNLENSSQSSTECGKHATVHKSPDATFFCEGYSLPPLVMEVSYSQHVKDLPRLAEAYIVDSRHSIRCVLALDITYAKKGSKRKHDRTATVSIWRPDLVYEEGEEVGVCKCDMDAAPFRNPEGDAVNGELKLIISDFLPTEMLENLPPAVAARSITISFGDLTQYLMDAEEHAKKLEMPPKTSSSTPKRFRKRKRSPAERLSEERERAYVAQEEAELQKESLDNEWKGTGWRCVEDADAGMEVDVELRRSKRNKSDRSATQGS